MFPKLTFWHTTAILEATKDPGRSSPMLIRQRIVPCLALMAGLFVAPALVGCSDDGTITTGSTAKANFVAGNWQISSADTQAARLPALSGTLNGTASAISGILHAQSPAACVSPASAVEVAGTADSSGNVKLAGALAGGSLTVTGTLAADGKSLTGATYNVAGGTCSFIKPADGVAQAYTPISGTYTGTFADADGQVAQISATLNQSANADNDGNYTLTGAATLPGNPCFPSAVPVSATQVTGGTFTFTYAANGSSVTANGTFSSDASTLVVSSWISSGSCGADTGTGSMAVQAQP